MIQVCTRLWPEPGPHTRTVPFPASLTGMTEVPVLEPERRKKHIDMIDRGHGLLPIAVDCLHYQENERPSSEELCQRLADLKETREYRESVEQVERVQDDVVELERQMGEMQVREAATVQQLHELRVEIQQLHQRYNSETRRLSQQLEEQEQVTAEIQQTNNSLQRQVEQLQQQLSQQTRQNTKPFHSMKEKQSQPLLQQVHRQEPHPHMRKMKLGQWRDGGRAPYRMIRGAAVVDGNVAYFMNWDGQSCSYDSFTHRWSELPQCPYWYSSLAVVRGLLTAIGGMKQSLDGHNKLLSIVNNKDQKWVEHFPSMPTKRYNSAAVTIKQHLIVAGGLSELNQLDTVEVMDIQTLVWSTAASLSHPYFLASATICGDQLFMLGGLDKDGIKTESVLTCLLTELLQSCSKTSSDSVWHKVANVPVYKSTCAAVNGELVAVGGVDGEGKDIAAVHMYNSATDSWDIISNIPTAQYHCLIAVLPTNEIMVVSGCISSSNINKVEIASIEYM